MRNLRASSTMLAAAALALAASSAHFPTGIADGPRGLSTSRAKRRKPTIQVHVQQRADIAAWNAEVDAKKRAKKAAKLAKRAQSLPTPYP